MIGLRGEIRTPIVPISVRSDYMQLVNVALWVEKSLGVKRPRYELGKEKEKGSVRNKKTKTTVSQGSRWTSDQMTKCNDCVRNHTGIC